MEPFILIHPEQPGYYYALFYLLAFLTGFVWLMIEGHKCHFPVIPWMLVIATAFLFFMIGCRLIAFSPGEWGYVWHFVPIPYSTARSVLGGILFSIPGILLAKKCLKFNYEMMDAFAFVLPLALIVQRFGCLMAGCCYGTPSGLPWAIQFGPASRVFAQHVHDSLLSADSALALPVHPVQVYEVLGCLAIVIVLAKIRKAISAPGNFLLASIVLYGIVRFLIEFVRASGGHSVGGASAFGLNYVQWAILLIAPCLILFIIYRERRGVLQVPIQEMKNEFFRPATYFLLIGTLFLFVSRWLTPLDIISFNIVLLPMLATLTWYLFTWVTVPRLRLATLVLPLLALFLMNQTLPEYSKKDSTRLSYNTVCVGHLGGHSYMSFGYEDCNGGNLTSYDNYYSANALGVGRTVQLGPENSISFGANAFKGSHSENVYSSSLPITANNVYSTTGISPYVQFDYSKFGLGAGFTAGDFVRIVPVADGDPTSLKRINFYPSFNFRVGSLRQVFLEYKFANQFPTAFPSLNHQFAVGFGVGHRKKAAIRFGTASNIGFMISTSFPIGDQLMFDIYTGTGGGLGNSYGHVTNTIAAFNLHFKFNKKERPQEYKAH